MSPLVLASQTFRVPLIRILWGGVSLVAMIASVEAFGGSILNSNAERTNHVVLIDETGRLLHPDVAGFPKFEEQDDAKGYIDGLVERAAASDAGQILLFVHGGLTSDGIKGFDANFEALTCAGYYPIYVVWPSGLWDCYAEHLLRVREGELVRRVWGWATSPLVLVADIGRGITRAPIVWWSVLRNDLRSNNSAHLAQRHTFEAARERYQAMRLSSTNRDKPIISIGSDRRTWWELAWYSSRFAAMLPLKLATSPIIDAAGKSAWDNMLRRTENAFPSRLVSYTNAMANRTALAPKAGVKRNSPANVGLPLLARALERQPNLPPITLVGHSMGTIILNRMLDGETNNYPRVVFMAAACTIEQFRQTTGVYLNRANATTEFYNISLHPAAEAREVNYFDIPPRGSLLTWIDEFLSTPLNVSGRTLGKWDNLFTVDLQGRYQIDELITPVNRNRIFFKGFDCGYGSIANRTRLQWNMESDTASGAPLAWNPESHSAFNSPGSWNEMNWSPVALSKQP
jgi:hypothetical protein